MLSRKPRETDVRQVESRPLHKTVTNASRLRENKHGTSEGNRVLGDGNSRVREKERKKDTGSSSLRTLVIVSAF